MPSYTHWTWSEPNQRHFCHLLADDGLTILDTLWAGPDNSPALTTTLLPRTLPLPAKSPKHGGASGNTTSFSSAKPISNMPQNREAIYRTVGDLPSSLDIGSFSSSKPVSNRLQDSGAADTIHNGSSSNPNMTLVPGQHIEIAHRNMLPFRYVDRLGMGASAIVEIVVDQTGQRYAHKAFRKYYGRELKRFREEFRNEIDIMKRLRSNPHIIQVFGSYACGRELGMLLLPVANGGDLKTFLEDIKDTEESIPKTHMVILTCGFGCLASGLAFIHKHTIRHKDIKPSNILVHNGLMIYTDFGISLDASHQDETTTTGYHGAMTERFCAPEVARSEPRNRKSDVFSLGCVYIEILIVLLPHVDFGDKIPKPYWQKVDHIQGALTQESVAGQFTGAISDMLESRSANRIGAEELLNRLQGLRLKLKAPLFCNTCVPETSREPTPGASDWSETFADLNEAYGRHKYSSIQPRLLQEVERPLRTIDLVGEYIYIFTSPKRPDMVKIGVTSDVTERLMDLIHSCRLRFEEYWHSFPLERKRIVNAYRVERLVETEFSIKRKQQGLYCEGCQSSHVDWFNTSPEHAADVIEKFADWMETVPYEYDARLDLWVLTEYAKRHDLERICSLTAE